MVIILDDGTDFCGTRVAETLACGGVGVLRTADLAGGPVAWSLSGLEDGGVIGAGERVISLESVTGVLVRTLGAPRMVRQPG